jgi:hypothetical protein
MTGTFCGNRAMRLAALATLAVAAGPAAAHAGVGETVGVTAPAVPGAAVAPAVPAAPATPSLPSVPVSTPAVSAPAAPAPAASAAVETKIVSAAKSVSKPVAKKARVTRPAATKAGLSKPVASAAAKAGVKKDGTVTTTTSTTVDLRQLSNTSSNPLMGCWGSYQLCQTFPDFPYAAQNDCNGEQIPFVGRFTQWTQTSVNAVAGTVTVHLRSFFVGFKGQGDQGNVYTGTDTQNDFQRTFALGGAVTVDHRDYEVLIVTKRNPLDPAPNQYAYFHTVTNVDPADPLHPQIAVEGPYVVCTCGAKHSKDTDYRGKYNDDDSGAKHHHHEDYKGYNDDRNDWDD